MFVSIGNPVYDFIQTPMVSTGTRVLSGCSTNACLAWAKLGEPTALVGRVGADYAGRLTSDLTHYGIEYELNTCAETGGFHLVYDHRGDRTLDVLGVADPITTFPERFENADFILIGPILGEIPLDLVAEIRQRASAPLLLDPQGFVRRAVDGRVERYRNPTIEKVIPLCEVVKANEHEAEIITGVNPRQQGAKAVRKLHALGCRIAIVTLAEAGSLIYDGKQMYEIPAYTTVARDPTGAGDTYAAGFIYQYLRTPDDLRTVGYFASAVASVMVEHTGPDFALTLEEAKLRTQTLLKAK